MTIRRDPEGGLKSASRVSCRFERPPFCQLANRFTAQNGKIILLEAVSCIQRKAVQINIYNICFYSYGRKCFVLHTDNICAESNYFAPGLSIHNTAHMSLNTVAYHDFVRSQAQASFEAPKNKKKYYLLLLLIVTMFIINIVQNCGCTLNNLEASIELT